MWRREFGVEDINNDATIVEEESKTGKEIILGWDNQKRPCLYMFPGRQNVSKVKCVREQRGEWSELDIDRKERERRSERAPAEEERRQP